MTSQPEAPPPRLTEPCEVELISAHMAASIGQQKASAVVAAAVKELALPQAGQLTAGDADRLFDRLETEAGLVGLAAKVSRQMVRMGVAPLKPAF